MSKEEHIKRTLNNGLYRLLPDVGLLNEFVGYDKNRKAEIVYKKCLRNQKYKLASRIKIKYNLVNKHDDSVMAFGFALMAQAHYR